uniref:Uncharacterized protein n=1 Tax=Acrobeloides nanus TaxID=290746 RepID=A0A914CNU4_9BILA
MFKHKQFIPSVPAGDIILVWCIIIRRFLIQMLLVSPKQFAENSYALSFVVLGELVRDPSSQFSHLSKLLEASHDGGMIDTKLFSEHPGREAFVLFNSHQQSLLVKIRWPTGLVLQAGVASFESPKPFAALALADRSFAVKFVEIAK